MSWLQWLECGQALSDVHVLLGMFFHVVIMRVLADCKRGRWGGRGGGQHEGGVICVEYFLFQSHENA